jgi:hypothetical protein
MAVRASSRSANVTKPTARPCRRWARSVGWCVWGEREREGTGNERARGGRPAVPVAVCRRILPCPWDHGRGGAGAYAAPAGRRSRCFPHGRVRARLRVRPCTPLRPSTPRSTHGTQHAPRSQTGKASIPRRWIPLWRGRASGKRTGPRRWVGRLKKRGWQSLTFFSVLALHTTVKQQGPLGFHR